MADRPKIEPIRQPSLFEMGKLEKTVDPAGKYELERPYSDHLRSLRGSVVHECRQYRSVSET